MSLSRQKYLEEMGLSPLWVLREGRPGAVSVEPESPEVLEDNVLAAAAAGGEPEACLLVPPVSGGEALNPVSPVSVLNVDWPALLETVASCRACALCEARNQVVPGVGDRQADWMFIGEGPGAEEDARGEPFVGQAGKLLDSMLAAIDLERSENVYIANAVKCRPPGNRTPEAAEMAACWPYLQRQIALVRPKVIVLLGKAAVFAVLGEAGSLASLRGKPSAYRYGEIEIPVVVTYHPAYLLRSLPDKAKAWEDLCLARKLMRSQATGH